MPTFSNNPRLQVLVNGEEAGTIGVGSEFGSASVHVTWMKHSPDRWHGTNVVAHGLEVTTYDNEGQVFTHWFDRVIEAGDEVLIRVLPPGDFDPATSKRTYGEVVAEHKERVKAKTREERRAGSARKRRK
jgi:hypothetical protein